MKTATSLLSLVLLSITPLAVAQLTRLPNSTLALPQDPASEPGTYTAENAFGTLTFQLPIAIRHVPDQTSHLFVVQRNSTIERVDLTTNQRATFLNLASYLGDTENPRRRLNTSSECGILSFTFHPDYRQNGYFYVFYSLNLTDASNQNNQRYQRVSRFQATGTPGSYHLATTADPTTELPLISQRDEAGNHNGGDIHFGADGYLYISTGDEGGANDTYDNARFIDRDFFSAILRIDVDQLPANLSPNPHTNEPSGAHISSAVHPGTYAIPADNPFIGATTHHGQNLNTGSLRTEFWAVGFRNPWRMSFDPPTGRLFVADVGQGALEEVDLVEAGRDYGWSYREGTNAFNNGPGGSTPPAAFAPTDPIHDYPRSEGRSITGGLVYRGARLAELNGQYIFADFVSGRIWALEENGGNWSATQIHQESGNNIVAFGVDPRNGDLLYCCIGQGVVKRLVRSEPTGTPLPELLSETGAFSDLTTLTPEAGIVGYEPNLPFWSDHAIKERWFSIPNVADTMSWAEDANWAFPAGQVWIKHFEIEMERGNPASRRRLETRFLVKTATDAYAVTYKWRPDESDADLVGAAGFDEELAITDGGIPAPQTWRYPSQAECMTCHTTAAGFALSFNTRQLNRPHTYGGPAINQLQAFLDAGYFDQPLPTITGLPRLIRPDEVDQSLEIRARSYLSANCAQCHQPGGGGGGTWDLRAHLDTDETGIIDGILNNPNGDTANRLIAPGDTAHSMVLTRMEGNGGLTRMPPIGNRVTDPIGVALLTDWIVNELPGRLSFEQWQIVHFGSTTAPEAAAGFDADGDGRSNRREYLAYTDPWIADPGPQLTLNPVTAGQWELQVPRLFNRSLLIETSQNLIDWEPWDVPENEWRFPASGGGVRTILGPAEGEEGFFRARFSAP